MGAAYGTAKSGIGIAGVGTFRPDLIMKVQRARHDRSSGRLLRAFAVVSDPGRNGWHHCSVLSCDIRVNRRGYGAAAETKIQSFQVR